MLGLSIQEPPKDLNSVFYKQRPLGIDYLPPWSIQNPVCYGTASPILDPNSQEPVEISHALQIITPDINIDPLRQFYQETAPKLDALIDLFVLEENSDEVVLRMMKLVHSDCFEKDPNTGKVSDKPDFQFYDIKELKREEISKEMDIFYWNQLVLDYGIKPKSGQIVQVKEESKEQVEEINL